MRITLEHPDKRVFEFKTATIDCTGAARILWMMYPHREALETPEKFPFLQPREAYTSVTLSEATFGNLIELCQEAVKLSEVWSG